MIGGTEAFSGAKQTMEVLNVSLDELERLSMPESVERDQHLPPGWGTIGQQGIDRPFRGSRTCLRRPDTTGRCWRF